ncbi:MAG: magnesium transporter [Clostridiales bacterium]|jgi:magnesium transporter|nr:magnesium transporter [Clostridiales bacterium]
MNFEKWLNLIEENKFAALKADISDANEVDVAEFLSEVRDEKLVTVFRILPKAMSAEVFTYMTDEQRQKIILGVSDKEARSILDELFIDDTVDLLEEAPSNVVKKVLQNVDENNRKLINDFLLYPDDSVGGIMTVEFCEFHLQTTVAEAISIIRKTGSDKETVYTCYVIDSQRHLAGVVALKTLLHAADDVLVKDIMENNILSVNTLDDQEKAAEIISKYDFLALPVVDKEGRLVGIVTVDDAIDVMKEEVAEDIEIMAALNPSEKPYLKTSVFSMARNRIVWLLFLMISATATSMIMSKFESLLTSVIVLATFVPMLTGTGGNAGSQTSTLVIRGIALNEIRMKDIGRILIKEFSVGIICGIALGAVNFLRLILFRESIRVALVVSASICAVVTIADMLGGMLPVGAKALKLDPALMASPLITTIVDSVTLIVYFSLASLILNI